MGGRSNHSHGDNKQDGLIKNRKISAPQLILLCQVLVTPPKDNLLLSLIQETARHYKTQTLNKLRKMNENCGRIENISLHHHNHWNKPPTPPKSDLKAPRKRHCSAISSVDPPNTSPSQSG
jgi:hypothetical protein